MQFANLYLRTAGLAIVALAASACQTAQKPVSLLPPSPAIRASAPPAQPTRTPEPATAQTSPTAQTEPQPEQKKQAEPAPTSATQTPLEPVSDPIADLVARVEKDYQAGLADYQAGKTDAAKQDFDQAFNTLLGSNFDVKAEPRLEAEFNRIVAGVNRLDSSLTSDGLGGDKDAQAEDQQKSEPAPIDETNEIAPSADPNVKAKAQAEIRSTRSDLPLMMTDQVAGYISYFSNRGRGTFERAFARSGRYHDMMISILKQEGVPQDLIYLAQAESGFHPLAVSRVGARGIWQFMASRARGYGLSHNMYVDDRQDPEKSTRAAAHHLKDLYNQFGDWYLAMAAYNSGPGTVQAAVKRTGYADFWELYRRNVLPKETRNYVPIILAVTIMTKNLSQYGFEDVSMETPAKYDTVTINYPVDLRLVAECVSASQAELQDLNPSLLRLTTPRTGSFELYLPAGTKAEYQEMIATIPVADRLWWRLHTVKPGETLAALSRTYRIPAKTIAEANHLDDHQLEADSRVMIPFSPGKHPSDTATYAKRITRYKVHAGDTVESVADNFGISPQMLRRWNGIRGDSLRGRRVLALHLPITPSSEVDHSASAGKPSPRSKKPVEIAKAEKPVDPSSAETDQTPAVVRHKVKTGETLYSIATYYKTTVAALKRDNQNVAVLRPGMILIVQHGQ